MHRLGFMEKDIEDLAKYLNNNNNFIVKSIFTHLAASDEPTHDEFTIGQVKLYEKLYNKLQVCLNYKPLRHILNSAGIERFPQYQFDMARLGIGIYGISALNEDYLKPAASFTCKIIQIKDLSPNDGTVGYGRNGIIPGNISGSL